MRYHLCKLEWKDNMHTAEVEVSLNKTIHSGERGVGQGDQDIVGSKATSRSGLLAGEGIPFQQYFFSDKSEERNIYR